MVITRLRPSWDDPPSRVLGGVYLQRMPNLPPGLALSRASVFVTKTARRRGFGLWDPQKTNGWRAPKVDGSLGISCISGCKMMAIFAEQILATSAELTPNGGLLREISPNHLNSGLGIIVICPDFWYVKFRGQRLPLP